jgi:predicted Zn-dependent protease
LQKLLKKIGDFADIYIENRISRQIVIEESKFKSTLYGINLGAGVRVISGNNLRMNKTCAAMIVRVAEMQTGGK